jgi:tetratricopeptide (TPR) repeat protein
LAGELPPANEPVARWLRSKNPQVSPALAALLTRCLAHEAPHRYPNAGALASDLRRHLAQQPLKHVANRSLAERWQKWRRRRPYALMALALTTAFAASCFVIANIVRQRSHDAEGALQDARKEIEAGRFDLAEMTSDHGLSLAGALPWRGQLWHDLQTIRSVANQGARIQKLHSLVAELRARYGPEGLKTRDAERLESDARRLWKDRDLVLDESGESHPGGWSQVKDDLVDLALFWAAVQQRRVADDGPRRVAQDRIEILQEGERLVGARLIFCREIERLAKVVGNEPLAAKTAQLAVTLVPASGWEHYALGRSDLTAGNLPEADAHFKAAVDMNPRDLWPNFYHAKVAYELEQYEEAVTAFTVCVVLSDRAPQSYYYRGLASVQLGRNDDARHDFDRALQIDPDLADAALERGLLSYREERYDEAIADLKHASSDGADATSVAYGLALVYAAKEDRASAMHQLDVLFAQDPDHEGGRKLVDFLRRDGE